MSVSVVRFGLDDVLNPRSPPTYILGKSSMFITTDIWVRVTPHSPHTLFPVLKGGGSVTTIKVSSEGGANSGLPSSKPRR